MLSLTALLLLGAVPPPPDHQPLRFDPQETVSAVRPTVPPDVASLDLRLDVVDDRGLPEPNTIGEGTDDSDRPFPVVSTQEVLPFVATTSRTVLAGWGLKLSDGGAVPLRLTLKRFWVSERNQAVGATYQADVAFWWETGNGTTRGSVSGSATRYGRKMSEANRNEVLSDALKDALANLVSHPSLHRALLRPAPGVPEAEASPEERLRRLQELLEKGLISREEYDRKREEILRGL